MSHWLRDIFWLYKENNEDIIKPSKIILFGKIILKKIVLAIIHGQVQILILLQTAGHIILPDSILTY
jgi:hypothetical protein